jgi:O-methyltransferase
MSILTSLISDLLKSRNSHDSARKGTRMPAEEKSGVSIRDRYLNLLMDSLLNEIYLENEVRLLYVFSMLATGKPVNTEAVRQISVQLPQLVESVRVARQEGRNWWRLDVRDGGVTRRIDLRNVCQFSHTMVGRKRLQNIVHCLDVIRRDRVAGDLAETGAWRGGACILMRGYLAAWDIEDKAVWVADSFEGLPKPSLPQDAGYDFSAERVPILAVSLEEVRQNFHRYGLLDGQVRFLKGWFRDTLPTAPIDKLALLRLDGDLYESTFDALNALYHKVVRGGFVIIDDYGDLEPCRRAVDEFRSEHAIDDPLETIDWTGSYWRKSV